jgi:hypothetical protein
MKKGVLLLFLVLLIGCRSTAVIEKTPQEVMVANEAVLQMVQLTSKTAAANLASKGVVDIKVGDVLSNSSLVFLNFIDEIPFFRRDLEDYLAQINTTISKIGNELSLFIESNLLSEFTVADPFLLIESSQTAISRHFASFATNSIESWFLAKLEEDDELFKMWETLERTFNTYIFSHAKMWPDEAKYKVQLVNEEPKNAIIVTVLRQFFTDMRSEEQLLRAMAPTYDDELFKLFVNH